MIREDEKEVIKEEERLEERLLKGSPAEAREADNVEEEGEGEGGEEAGEEGAEGEGEGRQEVEEAPQEELDAKPPLQGARQSQEAQSSALEAAEKETEMKAEDLHIGKGAEDMVKAVRVLQRFYRFKKYRWFDLGRKTHPVQLPEHPGDQQIPVGIQSGRDPVTAWHDALRASRISEGDGSGEPNRIAIALSYLSEVGRFAAACRAAAVLAVHEVLLHPYGMDTQKHSKHHGPDSPREDGDRFKPPQLVTKDDPLWPLVRPRFDGDRVYVHDSIVLTVIGGNSHESSQEFAWRLYQHDVKGFQALADAISSNSQSHHWALPVAVLVDYLGFRVLCRPQILAIGDPPAEMVLGPFAEAEVAYGAPGDLPELWREATSSIDAAQQEQATNPVAYPGDSAENRWRQQLQTRSRAQFASLVLHEWDRRHPELRQELAEMASDLGLQGYPVCLMSDLPKPLASTSLLRLRSHSIPGARDPENPEGEELHFRSPAEVLPPEINLDPKPNNSRIVDPVKRLRREALWSLSVPPLPPTHAVTAAANVGQRVSSEPLKDVSNRAERELPQQVLDRISSEGPPLDSRGWTEVLHASGVNIRHMSRVASLASSSAAASLHREALARSAKWLLRKRLWKKKPWATVAPQVIHEVHMGPERTAALEVLKIFNLVLGSGADSENFWEQQLVPEAARRFGFAAKQLQRHHVKPHALFQAMEHHCRVKFELDAVSRPFFRAGYPNPLKEEDLALFTSSTLQPYFPHLAAMKDHWIRRLEHYDAVDEESRQIRDHLLQEPSFQGFWPDVRIICSRGEEWSAAVSAPTKHTRENRWDRVFQVLKLQLTFARAIGDSPAAVGGILQGIAVALLEMAKQSAEKPEKPDELDEIATAMQSRGPKADQTCLKKALWAADAATKMLPSTISSWWAQLAALEAEWLLEKHVEAHSRVQRLQTDWDRFCPDQPVLMLRLEGTAARLYAQQGDWASAAMHTERCCALAERAFGRTHGATIALRAPLGDAWSRREDWDKAVAAYQEAYSVAQVCSDEKTTGRLAFELAQVLFFKGDLTGAKGFAEDAVKLLIPLELGRSSGQLSGTSFEALTLLSKVYEDLCQRFLELHETEQAEVSPAMLQALVSKAIKCFETVLKNLPASEQAPRRAGVMSRAAQIVQSVLRLKVMGLGDSEYSVLVDAVEELLLHASVSETASALQRAMSQTRGVRQLQPRAETRAVAEAALRPVELEHAEEVPVKLMELFEEVAREALINGIPPSNWFDHMVRVVAEGFAGAPVPGDATYLATIQMLELCRFFGNAARVIMCATSSSQ
ncbi:unnamed protein product [Durusdinium trenchii]|uniref:Clu domain-containing protein n=1 Tax=Durusdinium trenchii TaxID=1381693 RepID=A0ABP0KLZ3_9DINO